MENLVEVCTMEEMQEKYNPTDQSQNFLEHNSITSDTSLKIYHFYQSESTSKTTIHFHPPSQQDSGEGREEKKGF